MADSFGEERPHDLCSGSQIYQALCVNRAVFGQSSLVDSLLGRVCLCCFLSLLLGPMLLLSLSERPSCRYSTRKTFITSSPRWFITLTAIRPDSGLSKGREVSLFSVAHASASISALSVVFNAL